jgi:hypothetical protein
MPLSPLVNRAIRTVDAREATPEIAAMRAEVRAEHPAGLVYEVVAAAGEGAAEVCRRVLPRLVYYLETKRIPQPASPGVVIALFVGEALHFVAAAAAFEAYRELEGIDGLTLAERITAWGKGDIPGADPAPRGDAAPGTKRN